MPDAPTDLAVPVSESDHVRGDAGAAVTLVEYGDYECPYCQASAPVVAALLGEFGGGLRFAFRHFPLNSVHARAAHAAQAAECAGAQGKFWAVHDLLFARRADLADVDLTALALRAGVEVYRFEGDLSAGRFARKVELDAEGGRAGGVTGTPTFFVDGRRVAGRDEASLRSEVAGALVSA